MRKTFRSILLSLPIATATFAVACAAPKGSPGDTGGAQYAALEDMPSTSASESLAQRSSHVLKTVFVIVMENHNWSSIHGNPSAPYINGTLLRDGAHAEKYVSPRSIHPSEPNYIWLEAGDNLAILDDDAPAANHRTTKVRVTRQLDTAAIGWKSYQEGITGEDCPLEARGHYAPKHNPMVFFDDATNNGDPKSAFCIAHVRPYDELSGDLDANNVAAYNFITPDMCNDMHDGDGCATSDSVKNGDTWLSHEVPKIMASKAYQDGGVIFVTWDESEGGEGESIGMIALSPNAKAGYSNSIPYTHSSLVRTVQDVFAVRPYIRDAANVSSLDDLFVHYP